MKDDENAANRQQEKDSSKAGIEKQQVRSIRESLERSKLYIELAVALCAIAGLIAVYWQLGEMKETNRLTRESLKMTRESNESSGEETKRTQELMAESNRLNREALEDNKRQSEASRKQSAADAEASRIQSAKDAVASLRLARESLDESRKALETSQRAELVLDHYEMREASPLPIATVYVRNAGHLTATDVRWSISFTHWGQSLDLPELQRIDSEFWKGNNPRTVLGSSAMLPIDVRFSPGQEQYPEMQFLYGLIQYSDGFNHERELLFCFYSNRRELGGAWRPCYGRNKVR